MRKILRFSAEKIPGLFPQPYGVEMNEETGKALLAMLHLPAIDSFTLAPEQLPGLHSAIADHLQYNSDLQDIANKPFRYYTSAVSNAQHLSRLLTELSEMARVAFEHKVNVYWTLTHR